MKHPSPWRPIRLPARHRLIWCLVLALVLATVQTARGDLTVTDDLGQTVRLEHPARRIIALYGAFNEILAAMGLEDRIVARTNTDRLPPSIIDKPNIGTHMRPNIELILGQRPDLVLQMAGRQAAADTVDTLKRYGLTTAFFQVTSFEELFSAIQRIGILTGAQDQAKVMIEGLTTRLDRVRQTLARVQDRPRVFFEVRYPNLLGAGKDSMVSRIIEAAGGTNCLTHEDKLVRLGEEELIRLNPQVYLIQKGSMNPDPIPLDQRPHFRTLSAVTDRKVFVVDEQRYSRPGPRNVDVVEELAALLHPSLFQGAQ